MNMPSEVPSEQIHGSITTLEVARKQKYEVDSSGERCDDVFAVTLPLAPAYQLLVGDP